MLLIVKSEDRTYGLPEYCKDLRGEEQGHQVIDWPGEGKV